MFEEFCANGGLSFEQVNTLPNLTKRAVDPYARQKMTLASKTLSHNLRDLSEFFGWNSQLRAGNQSDSASRQVTGAIGTRQKFVALTLPHQTAKIAPHYELPRTTAYPIAIGARQVGE